MVSRSLEKMVLIALGLTTVVIIGVPALMFAINTLGNATDLENAAVFADRLLNRTALVDLGITNNTEVRIMVPDYVTVSADGNTLTVFFQKEGMERTEWSKTYLHQVSLLTGVSSGDNSLTIRLVNGVVEILFTAVLL
ncbi:MAG: hypothetical protein ACFFAY_02265 [Promethearchaeota archaeon]